MQIHRNLGRCVAWSPKWSPEIPEWSSIDSSK